MDDNLFRTVPVAFLFDGAQNVQGGRFRRAPNAHAAAMGARFGTGFDQTGPQPLAGQFQKAEKTDPTHLNTGAVVAHGFLELPLDLSVVAPDFHVDEIDDNEPGEIAQAQLAGDFVGCLKVGSQRRLFDVSFFCGTPRVDVDGDKGFGGAENDVATGLELDFGRVNGVQLAFDVIMVHEGFTGFAVLFHPLGMAGNHQLHEILGHAVGGVAIDDNLVDVTAVEVADGTLDQVALFVDRGRSYRLQGQIADGVPKTHQIFVIALDFRLAAIDAGGSHDDGDTLGNAKIAENGFQSLAVGDIGDLPRDAAAACRVGHQYAIASGE